MDQPFLVAAAAVASLLSHPSVATRWAEPSALTGMPVGGLACHLGAQVVLGADVLTSAVPSDADRIDVMQHYERVKWRGAPLDNDANTAIRAGAETEASRGPDELATRVETALAAFPAAWAARGEWVYLPWAGWCLSPDDFLLTRLLEMTVHHDDLATSLGLDPIDLDPAVVRPVVGLLTDLALLVHGEVAVVRALARRERAPASIAVM